MEISLASITIQQITIFLRVAECGGFAKAAVSLNMTQSAVSKRIAKMEEELGIMLFRRTTREIHLTESGRILYDTWKDQIGILEEGYARALSAQNREDYILHIGILNTARPELFFWKIQDRFAALYPEVELELSSDYMTDLENDLAMGKYDLIMVPDFEKVSLENMGLNWKWAVRSQVCILMSCDHPLAGRTELKMDDILDEKFVTLNQKGRQNHLEDLKDRMSQYNAVPNIIASYQNAYEIKYLFRKQRDVLLFVDEYFDYPDTSDLVKIPLTDQKNGIICAWSPENRKPQLLKFLSTLSLKKNI